MSDISNVTNKPDLSGVTPTQFNTQQVVSTATNPDLGADVLESVAKSTPQHLNDYASPVPKLASPTVTLTATTDPNILAEGNFATLMPTDLTGTLLSALTKTQDPSATTPSDIVLNDQSIFAPLVANLTPLVTNTASASDATKSLLQQMASDPNSPLYGTNIPDVDANGNPMDYSGIKDIVYLLALLLGQLPTMASQNTSAVLQSLQNMTSAISNSIKEQIAQQEAAQKAQEQAEEAAKKTSFWSDLFGWVSAGLAIIAGIALIATGVGTAAGVGLLIGGGLMLANQIFQDTGLYTKSPIFATVMSYFMPIAQAIIAVATGGASEGFLAATSVALTCLSSATTVTDNILVETGTISQDSTADQALGYTAMGLGIASSAIGVGSSIKGEGATVESDPDPTPVQKGMKVVKNVAQTTESATLAVKSGLDIATGVTELKIADLVYQISLIKTNITKLNTTSDVDQQFIQTLVTALQQYLSMIPNISKSLNSLISSQGQAATAPLS